MTTHKEWYTGSKAGLEKKYRAIENELARVAKAFAARGLPVLP